MLQRITSNREGNQSNLTEKSTYSLLFPREGQRIAQTINAILPGEHTSSYIWLCDTTCTHWLLDRLDIAPSQRIAHKLP